MADQLCTPTQVKTRLFPAGASDATDDSLISEIIDEVSGWVQLFTGRRFVAISSTTKTFDTQSGYTFHIPMGVRSITTLNVASTNQPDSGGTYTAVTAADYLLRPKTDELPTGWPFTDIRISQAATGTIRRFYNAENGIQITGTFGFAAIPKEIEAVTIDASVVAYQSRKAGASTSFGAESGVLFPWSQYFGKSSPQRHTLEMYRHFGMA